VNFCNYFIVPIITLWNMQYAHFNNYSIKYLYTIVVSSYYNILCYCPAARLIYIKIGTYVHRNVLVFLTNFLQYFQVHTLNTYTLQSTNTQYYFLCKLITYNWQHRHIIIRSRSSNFYDYQITQKLPLNYLSECNASKPV